MNNQKHKKVEAMLYNYPKVKAQIKNLKLDIEEKTLDYTGVAGVSYSNFSAPTNKINSLVESEVINKDIEISRINALIRKKERESERIENALETLTDRENTIIEMRYFKKLSNVTIAYALDLTEEHICKIKRKSIIQLIDTILT